MRPRLDVRSPVLQIVGALVLIGLLAAGLWQVRSQAAARARARRADARVAYARNLLDATQALAAPLRDAAVATGELRANLQTQLASGSQAPDEVLAEQDRLTARLGELVTQLRTDATQPVPEHPDALPEGEGDAPTAQLVELRRTAQTLADDVQAHLDDVTDWSQRLHELHQAAGAFVQVAEEQPPTTDPGELQEQWAAERPALEAYVRAADDAAQRPGLAPVAEAHRAYASANLAWIDEATTLLADGRLGTYNARLDEVFASPDPFGFEAAVATATEAAMATGPPAALDALRDRLTALVTAATDLQRSIPEAFGAADGASRTHRGQAGRFSRPWPPAPAAPRPAVHAAG